MGIVYLLYGLAFLAAGLLLAFQARLPSGALPRSLLAWLAVFSLVHGTAELVFLAELALVPATLQGWMRRIGLTLLGLSFTALLQFAVELRIVLGGWTRFLRAIPLLVTGGVVALALTVDGGFPSATTAEIMLRYGLGLPAALLAADGFRRAGKVYDQVTPRTRRLFKLTGAILLLYGFLAGLVVPAAPFFPASALNISSFVEVTRVPVQVFRAACAAALAWVFSEAFIVELARSKRDMERQREEFIGVVAHDLRAPVTTIGLATEMLQRQMRVRDERVGELLERVQCSGRRLERMIADLLDAARIEAHRLSIEKDSIDLRRLILGVAGSSDGDDHPLRTVIEENLPMAEADPDRVAQVLTNLLTNAHKYSRQGSEIVVEASARARAVEVAVTNEARGLTPDDAQRVFNRYYRSAAAQATTPGLGVGLYIAKGLVEAQGGNIWVSFGGRDRVTFHFTLPRAEPIH